jgi:predicted  nucleic acid-binding Zn-ribbon protein
VIELFLYFVLGFLSAALLAALLAPAVLRRTAMLTRRRIEASVPLTFDEIRAEKDSLRAEYAVAARRLEMDLKAAKTKVSELSIKLARGSKDIKAIATERESSKAELARIEAEARGLRDELRRRDDGMQALSSALTKTEEMLHAQRLEFAKLGKEFEEASFTASARQIEIVARESEIDQLNSDIAALKGQRKAIERNTRNADSAVSMAKESALAEKRRSEALDARLAKLTAELSDREERLERRDREVARLRERLKPILASPPSADRDLKLLDLQAENMRLEAEIAELTERMAARAVDAPSNDQAPDRLSRLESRVSTLVRENRALRDKLAAPDVKNDAASRDLREQMQALAAEVVHLTASIEGAGSPIDAALSRANAQQDVPDAPVSLADRIRALRENPPASA